MQVKSVNQQEIFDLIAITPQCPENEVLLGQLHSLAESLSVGKEIFTYSNQLIGANGAAANGIAANTTSPQVNTQIDSSAMFIITSQSYAANTLNATQTRTTAVVPNVLVQLSDTSNNKPWTDVAVAIDAYFGNGQLPFVLPEPRIIPANTQITAVYTNVDAAAGFNVRLYFHGYKLYSLAR